MICIICNEEWPIYSFNIKRNIVGKEVIFRICDKCGKDSDLDDFSYLNEVLDKDGVIIKRNPIFDKRFEKYGITEEIYNSIYTNQKGRCAICETHQVFLEKRLAVNHNHRSKKVRGLLCSKCNTAIGLLKDNSKIIKRAADYVYYYKFI